MSEAVRAVLVELDGVVLPASFGAETLTQLTQARLGAFLAAHGSDPEVEEALEETGRLLGGFELLPGQAKPLLLRWMKQKRKAAPLKTIQGLIVQEALASRAVKVALYPEVAAALKSWAASGLRLVVFSAFPA